jgi:hypothetical protein
MDQPGGTNPAENRKLASAGPALGVDRVPLMALFNPLLLSWAVFAWL